MDSSTVKFKLLQPGQYNSSFSSPRIELTEALHDSPLVSAIMDTRRDLKKVFNSIQLFIRQKWERKELIIVAETNIVPIEEMLCAKKIKYKVVAAPNKGSEGPLLLGDLRNIGIAASSGDFICTWDDDDLYHPARISVMMSVIRRTGADAAILSQLLLYWYAKDKLALSKKSIWENSIVLKRSAAIVYPSLAKSSDNLMVQQLLLSRNVALVEAPYLYIYCVTGQNTWGADHFQYLFDRAELHFDNKKASELIQSNPAFEGITAYSGNREKSSI